MGDNWRWKRVNTELAELSLEELCQRLDRMAHIYNEKHGNHATLREASARLRALKENA